MYVHVTQSASQNDMLQPRFNLLQLQVKHETDITKKICKHM